MSQFSVPPTDVLSIFLRCNGFTGIQKAVVDQTGRRPPNSDHEPSLGASSAFGSALEFLLGPTAELVVTGCHYKIHFLLHVTIQSRNASLLLHRIKEDDTLK